MMNKSLNIYRISNSWDGTDETGRISLESENYRVIVFYGKI